MPASRWQGQVGVRTRAITNPAIFKAAISCGEQIGLVNGQGMHIRVTLENRLCAVAVMHVPVENEEPFCGSGGARCRDGDPDIGQQAEAHPLVCKAVMARRAGQRIGRVMPAGQHSKHRVTGKPGGLAGNFK